MQYIHVTSKEEYNQLMDIFEKKGWKWSSWSSPKGYNWFIHGKNTCISNEDKFVFNQICDLIKSYNYISFQDYLKQESITSEANDTNLKFWDLVDVRDSDGEGWRKWCYYYVASVEWVHIVVFSEEKLDSIKDWSDEINIYSYKQVRKHEEEKVTITITKSEYEKVKEFLNK